MTDQVRRGTSRGQSLVALGAVLGGWIAVRAALFVPPVLPSHVLPNIVGKLPRIVTEPSIPLRHGARNARRAERQLGGAGVMASSGPLAPVVDESKTFASPTTLLAKETLPSVAAPTQPSLSPHTMLWMAAMHAVPVPSELLSALEAGRLPEAGVARAAPGLQTPATANTQKPPRRWSGDAWTFLRPSGLALGATGGTGPSYGASQAGAVLRYDLSRASAARPQAYLRAASALAAVSPDRNAAVGLSVQPVKGVPLRAFAEARAIQSGARLALRPAAFVAGGSEKTLSPFAERVRLSGYAEGGVVAKVTPFAGGHILAERVFGSDDARPLVAAGAGAWGGVQRGAGRLDVGPAASFRLRHGELAGRISADYRLRIAGNAEPASGAAVTVSLGF